jgi:HSP20 family protein
MADKSRKDVELAPWFYWSPGNMFENMERMFGELNDRFGGDLHPAIVDTRSPAIDMRDEGDSYVLRADLPGMKKENVTIEMTDDYLEISGVREESREESREGYLWKERGSARFFRRLPLPEDADPDEVKAKLDDGVLELKISKRAQTEQKKRKVDVE